MKVLVLLALVGAACAAAVQYTKEVADARAQFQATYDAAAKRAEAAPDTDLDGKLSAYSGFLSAIDGRMSPLYTNNFGAYGIHSPMRTPWFNGANLIAGTPMAAGAPLAYSGLGFPGAFRPHGFYGPYGYPF